MHADEGIKGLVMGHIKCCHWKAELLVCRNHPFVPFAHSPFTLCNTTNKMENQGFHCLPSTFYLSLDYFLCELLLCIV